MTSADFEIVVTSYPPFREPHAEALREFNPGVAIHSRELPELDGEEKFHAWRNADRVIREWWKEHRETVAAGRVVFMESDVWCNVPLAEVFHGPFGELDLAAAKVFYQVRDRRGWYGFREIERLPYALRDAAIGIEPLAVVSLSRAALDALAAPEYDAVFAADIFCELRLPTVVQHAGLDVGFCPGLDRCGVKPTLPKRGERGVFHPVKREVVR